MNDDLELPIVWLTSGLCCAKQIEKSPPQNSYTRTFSQWRLTCFVNQCVCFVNNVSVRDCGCANVCVCVCVWWGLLRFCCWCLKSPCLSLFQAESTTLTWPWTVGWLCLLHGFFNPPRKTLSICTPPNPIGRDTGCHVPTETHTYVCRSMRFLVTIWVGHNVVVCKMY